MIKLNTKKLQQKDTFLLSITMRSMFEFFANPGGLFLTSYMLFLGLMDYQIGYVVGFIALTNVLQLFSPMFYEKFKSPKRMTLVARSLRFVIFYFMMLLPWFQSYRYVILLFIIFSSLSFTAFMGGTFLAWNDQIIPLERKGRYYATRNLIANAIGILLPIILGKILDHYVHTSGLFMIIFCVSIVFALGELWIITKLHDHPLETKSNRPLNKLLVMPLKDKKYRRFMIFSLLWMFAWSFARPFFNVYAISHLRLSYSYIALVSSITAIVKLLLAKLWGAGVDHYGWKKIMGYTGLLFAVSHFLWLFIALETHVIYFIFIFLNGIFMIGLNIAKFNVNLQLTDHAYRLSYLAVNAAIMAVFSFVSTNISTMIIRGINQEWTLWSLDIFQVLFAIAGLLYLLAIFYIMRRKW
ncbi:MFS transporter [Vallitalea pronyensis]|uniref:MFS transporter n=1 Tax=Vallitalea pronyensis TaxID=1348613 RepID=A0A8J8MNC9_9FIRM|nr:MFS transporter [Vallitalea pronyensis]QUI24634.1 MFS transporter [Vallitalea pronyensis]